MIPFCIGRKNKKRVARTILAARFMLTTVLTTGKNLSKFIKTFEFFYKKPIFGFLNKKQRKRTKNRLFQSILVLLAEKEGFEPSRRSTRPTPLAGV